MLQLHLRRRVAQQDADGQLLWQERNMPAALVPEQTSLLICDVWDRHWCRSAMRRCDALAQKIAPVVEAARAQGVQIIHTPSDCMEFYADSPARRRMASVIPVDPPPAPELPELPLPIDDSDGGCDDESPCPTSRAWTRQHPAIRITDEDAITDSGPEVYSLLRAHGLTTLLILGVHTNMCVLNRSFGIKQMTRWGVPCVLVRDLTDTMYNPRMRPFVAHDAGTALVIEHIEQCWCPTTLSADLRGTP